LDQPQPTQPDGSDAWKLALDWVLGEEGGYSNDPDDAGGETRFGISFRAHPNVDIANLTRAAAAEIYRREYWLASGADHLPAALGIALFDGAVNQGRRRSVNLLQASLGVAQDGIVGLQTIAAANACDVREVLSDFLSWRTVAYSELAEEKPSQQRFRRGWFKRLFQLQAVCLSALEVRT
jgi:lysozyme family protein